MNEYISVLKELLVNFSYKKFVDLLKEIDKKLANSSEVFGEEFLFYFNQLINLVNDNYIVDGEPGTLGHKLVEDALLNKEKLTPSLLLCFFLEQKNRIGLEDYCNEVVFGITRHMADVDFRMAVVHLNDIERSYMCINRNNRVYKSLEGDVDKYNYRMLWDILHELTHVYQLSKSKDKGTAFERLARYDYEIGGILNDNNANPANPMFHESLVCEFMANEQARVYLLNIAQKYPKYFNFELIQNERESYFNARNGMFNGKFDEFMYDVRFRFETLISDMKEFNQGDSKAMEILDRIDLLRKEAQPLIEELKRDGISERMEDNYYSIFLESLYHFDGNEIVLIESPKKLVSKCI